MGASDDVGGLDRVAANERHVLADIGRRAVDALIVLECECTHTVCDQRIELTREQYEPIRSSAARYAVYPHDAHVEPRVDEVVDRHVSYWVVERQASAEVLDFYRAKLAATPLPAGDPSACA